MTRIALIGAAGRMGQAISRLAGDQIVVRIEAGDSIDHSLGEANVVIDFSHAEATQRNCEAALAAGKPMVIGTTGHTAEQLARINAASKQIPVLLAANFSVGVNTLFWLARQANKLLGEDFDIEIVEMHHRLKKDAPSGTAKRLAQILAEARELEYERDVAHGREGLVGERPVRQIGLHALRGGDVVGDHTVIFAGEGERLELTHKASSRDTFAAGALRAADWILGKPAGRYEMEDVLGLR